MDTAHRIVAERHRQMAEEGYDASHDDHHFDGELLYAALAYVCTPGDIVWPFESYEFKPSDDPIRNIVKAGALLSAEGDRLLRRRQKGLSVTGGLVVLGVGPDEHLEVIEGLSRIASELERARLPKD